MRLSIVLVFYVGAILYGVSGDSSSSTMHLQSLFDAIKDGNVESVQELIKNHDVNATNNVVRTALHVAAEYDNDKIVEFLIKKSANVNAADFDGVFPLHWAGLSRDEKIANLLIQSGANVSVTDDSGRTPIFFSAYNPNENVTKLLIDNGADVNITKHPGLATPLHMAAMNGNEKTVQLLIQKSANVNAEDAEGCSSLYYAIYNGSRFFKLVMAQAAENRVYSFRKLAEYALAQNERNNHTNAGENIAKLLLEKGVNINHKDIEGRTPLDAAIFYGNPKLIDFLTKNGAKKSVEN